MTTLRFGARRRAVGAAAALLLGLSGSAAQAQAITDTLVVRALELEGNGAARDAVPLYRRALDGSDAVTALLGLERVFAELGQLDSLLVPLDRVLARHPDDVSARTVQLRTLQALHRGDELRAAVAAWAQVARRDPAPYRELARILIAEGRTTAADSVLRDGQRALGDAAPFAAEIAQVRAAAGAWPEAATAWRTALATQPWLAEAAAYALQHTPVPARDAVRAALRHAPTATAARLALASLESRWGSHAEGWAVLRDLPVDSASAVAWIAFGEQAEAEARWAQAREAFEAALRWRDDAALRIRAAGAALESGDPAAVPRLAPLASATSDSGGVARELVPLHVRALARLGRAAEAARLATAFDRFLAPGLRSALARSVAMGWVRSGDLTRAGAALRAAGDGADSSSAAGWIALFEGDALRARALLASGEERSADVALALAVLARHRAPRTPVIGAAFLALLRGDTTAAAAGFEAAADSAADAASLLVLTAARLRATAGDTASAMRGWLRVVDAYGASPEAPEALLSLARALRAAGQAQRSNERLEQLVLSHPTSALVPVARRELELSRTSAPAGP